VGFVLQVVVVRGSSSMSILLNQTQFAKLVGCSQQNISKHIKSGVIEVIDKKINKDNGIKSLKDHGLLDEDGKLIKSRSKKSKKSDDRNFHKVESLPFEGEVPYDSYAYLTDEEKEKIDQEKRDAIKELEEKQKEAESKNIAPLGKDLGDIKYADAKTHREHFMGLIAEMDYHIKMGEYISKAEVETAQFEMARVVRDGLLVLPSKMSLRVVGKTDIKVIEDILMEEIQSVLENLSS
jgi:hypothetical protein